MKKGKSKKLVAWLLAFAILMSPSTGFRVFADDDDGAVQGAVVSTTAEDSTADDVAAATDGQDMVNAVTPADPDDQTAQDEPVVTDTLVDTGDSDTPDIQTDSGEPTEGDSAITGEPVADGSSESEEPAVSEQEENPEVEDGGLINLLFIEEQSLQAPGEQNVIISFGDGSEQLASVKLILAGEDGRQTEIPLTQKVSSYYQFVKTYESQEAGTYRPIAFTYELDGHKKRIELEEKAGIDSKFTVFADTSETGGPEEPSISVTTTTSDDISASMEDEIQSTIQEAADEAVDEILDGVVELGASSTSQAYGQAGVSAELTAVTDKAVKLGSYSAPRAYTGTTSMVVVLDPGHGGKDKGSSDNGLAESELNLKVAKYCKATLESRGGITVYMTRTDDTFVSLEDRAKFAKGKGATIFVSLHMNSATVASAQGVEVYYPNENYNNRVHEEGKDLAESVLNELKALGLVDRGVKKGYYEPDAPNGKTELYPDGSRADALSVIRDCKKIGVPAILVEHAFISNVEDAKNLKDENFLQKLGEADARGILKYSKETTDYSSVYDFDYYMKNNSDLRAIYANDKAGAFQHFVNLGMEQGRRASAEFNVSFYMNHYKDLREAFGSDLEQYYLHYINYGKAEGRLGAEPDSSTQTNADTTAVQDGVNYGDVYDFDYYIERYPDLKAVFANSPIKALEHFIIFGMAEGRQAKGTFDVNSYKSRYPDLRTAFGSNLKAYYIHYITYGKKEGRIAVEGDSTDNSSSAVIGTSVYRGVDLSPIYDFNYYIEKYQDIKQAYGNSPEKAIEHFVRFGMDEGRSGNADFNVHAYRSRYSDLRAAFGNDLKEYYEHYLTHGMKEGRSCALVVVTTYKGVDYSAVYNFEYYIGNYTDLAAVFENDPAGALEHYVTYGIREGRQANYDFNIEAYKNNYVDLRKAFGDNNQAYVEHYINYGITERRDARNFVYHWIDNRDIESASYLRTTVDQMVRYFLANASYPTYYANNSNVGTIREFCALYYEECGDEGINPAVAFCQAMKETNFLRFTGDVSISQFNFAGLGATGNGVAGLSFPDIRTGIRAHVQHLKAYANTDQLNNTCVDPRFRYVQRGSAMYVEWLGIQENPIPGCGWAVSPGYGSSIIDYIGKLTTY